MHGGFKELPVICFKIPVSTLCTHTFKFLIVALKWPFRPRDLQYVFFSIRDYLCVKLISLLWIMIFNIVNYDQFYFKFVIQDSQRSIAGQLNFMPVQMKSNMSSCVWVHYFNISLTRCKFLPINIPRIYGCHVF